MSPNSDRSSVFRYAEFNLSALCDLASRLREGKACSCDEAQKPLFGTFNWAITISFDDGLEWLLCSPMKYEPISSALFVSEAVLSDISRPTVQFLSRRFLPIDSLLAEGDFIKLIYTEWVTG